MLGEGNGGLQRKLLSMNDVEFELKNKRFTGQYDNCERSDLPQDVALVEVLQ